ncbi:MAG: DUF1573 domain-containing protein [bacterium]|nr:DUF1573 domain-containing protein [bacterium]
MNRTRIIIFFLFCFIPGTAFVQPILKLNKTKIDLGTLPGQTVITDSSLVMRNAGTVSLEVSVQSTCDCLSVFPVQNRLLPREKIRIKIRLETRDESGKTGKKFYLITNDPRYASVPIMVQAVVRNKHAIPERDKGMTGHRRTPRTAPASGTAVHYFYSPSCRKCAELLSGFFPAQARRYYRDIRVIPHDIGKKEEFELLMAYQDRFHKKEVRDIPVLIAGTNYLAGLSAIRLRFPGLIREKEGFGFLSLMNGRKGRGVFTSLLSFWPVFWAGLTDGINPCAFATIIFLLSYLSYLKKKRSLIFFTGLFYILGVYLTYFSIGLGFLTGIRSLPFFYPVSRIINGLIAFFCFILAYFSFLDYRKARKGRLKEMKLQLSLDLKSRIHGAIRARTGKGMIMVSSFILGVLVSFFELACTGQVYLPTIIYLTRSSSAVGYVYLSLYNLLFILPLAVIFILFYRGVSSKRMARFLEKKVAIIKLLTTLFFIAIGSLLFYLSL